jgi:hypothetical protein
MHRYTLACPKDKEMECQHDSPIRICEASGLAKLQWSVHDSVRMVEGRPGW